MMKIKQEIPDWFYGEIYDEGDNVTNRFGGNGCYLNNIELSIYDFIIGATMYLEHIPTSIKLSGNMQEKNKILMRDLIKAIDWFRHNNPKAYMVLID